MIFCSAGKAMSTGAQINWNLRNNASRSRIVLCNTQLGNSSFRAPINTREEPADPDH